jgi:hypothetical protein
MKKQVTILAIILSACNLIAQDTAIKCKKYAWGFYPCVTYYNVNLTSINNQGWMLGRPKNNQIMVGAGANCGNPNCFYASADFSVDVLTLGETSGAFEDSPSINVSCYGYKLSLNGYYKLIGLKKLGVYANLGTSFENIYIHSQNYKPSGAQDTISVFEDFNLRQNFLMNGGLSVYFYDMKSGYATGVIALKAGYDWAPFSPSAFTWYDYNDNTRTRTNPIVSFNGFYAGIVFNIWFVKDSKCSFH